MVVVGGNLGGSSLLVVKECWYGAGDWKRHDNVDIMEGGWEVSIM